VPFCPNCGAVVDAGVAGCLVCKADFGPESEWRPVTELGASPYPAPPPFNWLRAWRFAAVGIVLSFVAYRASGWPGWILVVPFAGWMGGMHSWSFRHLFASSAMLLILVGVLLEAGAIDLFFATHYRPDISRAAGLAPLLVATALDYVVAPATFVVALLTMIFITAASRGWKRAAPTIALCACAMLVSVFSYYAFGFASSAPDWVQRLLQRIYQSP
jgi:hypothetical protein